MPRGLLDMPEDVMTKIMEDIGIKEILNLRKVCHDLRNFIDDVKPDVNLEKIEIDDRGFSVSVVFHFLGGVHRVYYEKHEKGCLVRKMYERNGVVLKNEDFANVSMKDFEILLGHQKSVLKQFSLIGLEEDNMNEILLENLQHILKSRIPPLKVETFIATGMNQTQVMSILPSLDSKSLNTLEIRNRENFEEIDQLAKLDQWKNVKHIVCTADIDLKYIHNFTHFSTADASFNCDNLPDLVSLKDVFIQSSGFEKIKIRPKDYLLINLYKWCTALLGEPFTEYLIEDDYDSDIDVMKWFYRIQSTNQVLEICVIHNEEYIPIVLTRIEESRVPDGAVIQN